MWTASLEKLGRLRRKIGLDFDGAAVARFLKAIDELTVQGPEDRWSAETFGMTTRIGLDRRQTSRRESLG